MGVVGAFEVSLAHFFVFRLHAEIVFDLCLQHIEKLSAVLRPVAEKLCAHIEVASLSLLVFIQVELVKEDRLVLVKDVPAYAGIICDQHPAAHQHLVYGHLAERDQMDTALLSAEVFYIVLEFRVKIKIYLQIVFFQDIRETPGI